MSSSVLSAKSEEEEKPLDRSKTADFGDAPVVEETKELDAIAEDDEEDRSTFS